MPDEEPTLASAVVVPDAPAPPSPQDHPHKRRQSSVSESGSKRPRLSVDETNSTSPDGATKGDTDRRADRRRNGQLEERKRGQRLFGALLGTLSQSSSSAAQRRRADIEKKQQEKLKRQAEEFDQNKKERLEELMAVRRREQKKFDEQSMRIRHSNLIAMAHSLKTKTEPVLHYRPWELRPEEEEIIKAQVEEAEATVDKELEEFSRRRDAEREQEESGDATKADSEAKKPSETVGAEPTEEPLKSPSLEQGDTNQATTTTSQPEPVPTQEDDHASKEAELKSKEHGDDNGEEVLEAEEDTVIY